MADISKLHSIKLYFENLESDEPYRHRVHAKRRRIQTELKHLRNELSELCAVVVAIKPR